MIDRYILNEYTILFNYQSEYEHCIEKYSKKLSNGENIIYLQSMQYLVGINLLDHFEEYELKNVVINHRLSIISTSNKFVIFNMRNGTFKKYNMPINEEYHWTHRYKPNKLITVYKDVITLYVLKNDGILEKKCDISHKFTGKIKILSSNEYVLITDTKKGLVINTMDNNMILGNLSFDVEDMDDVGEIMKFVHLHGGFYKIIKFTIGYVTKTDNYKLNDFIYDYNNNGINLDSSHKYIIKNGIKCIFNENKQKSARSIIR